MVKFKRNTTLLAKVETTAGVDSVPTAADHSLEIIDTTPEPNFSPVEREIQTSSRSGKAPLSGAKFTEVTFSTELHGSGSAGTAPRIGALFQACGCAETVSASSVVYTPTTDNLKTVTLYIERDGVFHKITGAMGNAKIILAVNSLPTVEWSFSGVYNAPVDSAIATPTFDGINPVPVQSAGLTYNSISTLVASQWDCDFGNEVVQRPDLNASTGIAGFTAPTIKPVMTFDPEQESISTIDWWSDMLTTTRSFTIGPIGSVSGNIFEFSSQYTMVETVNSQDRDGINVDAITARCSTSSGDDNFTLTFR